MFYSLDKPEHPSKLLQFDYGLLLGLLLSTGFGLLVLDGTTYGVAGLQYIIPRQLLWCGVSLAVFSIALLFPYRWLHVFGPVFYIISIALLVLLAVANRFEIGFLSGIKAQGAASWMRVTIGSHTQTFQPSEFAKIATVIVLAQWLDWRGRHRLGGFKACGVPLLLTIIPIVIIFKQPDFGTASVFMPLPIIMLFVAGLRWRVVLTAMLIISLILGAALIYLSTADSVPGLRQYQLKRIRVFLEPLRTPFRAPQIDHLLYGNQQAKNENTPRSVSQNADDWNIKQAEMALGSGQWTGRGYRKGTQARMRFLPQAHTDFIFSSLGEQFGLIGILGLFSLYIFLLWRMIHITMVTNDAFGRYLVIGFCSIFLTHVFLNIAMSVRLLPVTGLPLPFFSYGGSFLASNFLMFGLIANVGMRRQRDD